MCEDQDVICDEGSSSRGLTLATVYGDVFLVHTAERITAGIGMATSPPPFK